MSTAAPRADAFSPKRKKRARSISPPPVSSHVDPTKAPNINEFGGRDAWLVEPRAVEKSRRIVGYHYYMLQAKFLDEQRGWGVIARQQVFAGFAFPIIGNLKDRTNGKGTWDWNYNKDFITELAGYTVDGDPSYMSFRNVGSMGLAITMLINEPVVEIPNVIIHNDMFLVCRDIAAGEELLCVYSLDVTAEKTRQAKGYSLAGNRYMPPSDVEARQRWFTKMYPLVDAIEGHFNDFPDDYAQRVLNKWFLYLNMIKADLKQKEMEKAIELLKAEVELLKSF